MPAPGNSLEDVAMAEQSICTSSLHLILAYSRPVTLTSSLSVSLSLTALPSLRLTFCALTRDGLRLLLGSAQAFLQACEVLYLAVECGGQVEALAGSLVHTVPAPHPITQLGCSPPTYSHCLRVVPHQRCR